MIDVSKKTTNAVRISAEKYKAFQNGVKNILSLKEIIKNGLSQNISELAEIIFGGAVILDASDIHIEPEEREARVRIRIDGVLQDVIAINKDVYQNLLSRIKLLSELKLNIADRPQDGRFTILISGDSVENSVEIRTSTLPSEYGESIVLRVLNPKSLISLEALGLRKDLYSLFKKEIKKPNGMIIVTGPTGAGKTTTLYAFLKEIHKPEIKIITIEDPIEYHLQGVSQTQVAPEKKYDFASGLKSIMRQDPDVILVGEIRDLETAEIALQAALTGHLVFTTLHTNDAAGTITRLISLGAKAINIGPALNMAIAQRLVRKVCPKCLREKVISGIDFKKIKDGLSNLPKTADSPQLTATTKIPEPNLKGCNYCNFTGYKGRVGIFEAILADDEMENFILKNPSIASLKKEAIEKGMTTMLQDGFIKVLRGITTIEEVERMAGE
ncbi:MAG: GspE/PulE family protein [bacterium]|nr:GspE/PulE family protein [bacterium]